MKNIVNVLPLVLSTSLIAQVPIIDYGFLADDPSVVVNSVLVQPDGKILVGGVFFNYAGTGLDHLVRLNTDGTVDPTFNPGGTGPGNGVSDMALMPDGRIVICGNFLNYNGTASCFVARVHANGTLDNSFNIPPNSINGAVLAIALHAENKVIAGGEFFTCYGHSSPHIVRFNTDGSVDTTFVVGAGFDNNVHDILVLPDMRVVVGGQFAHYQGTPSGHIALLAQNGMLDTSMDNDPGLVAVGGIVRGLALQPDGMVLAGGYFQYHDGLARSAVERLNLDGTHDPLFTSALGGSAVVRSVAVQPDGRIVLGGEFTTTEYVGMQPGPARLVRLMADGSVDPDLEVGSGIGPGNSPTAYVQALAVQPDGKILVGGHFGTVDTETQYRQLVRLHGNVVNDVGDVTGNSGLNVWNDGYGSLWLRTGPRSADAAVIELHDLTGRLLRAERPGPGPGTLRMPAPAVPGLYFVSLVDAEQRATARVVVE